MPWPNTNREFVVTNSCTYQENTSRYISLQKSINHNKCPETSKLVRAKMKSCFIVEKINDKKCRYIYQIVIDFGGYLNSDFFSNTLKDKANNFHMLLLSALTEREITTRPTYGGMLESLEYALAHNDQEK